jgi:acyl-CoA thioesterase-1
VVRAFAFHFAGGDAFFTGAMLLLSATLTLFLWTSAAGRIVARLCGWLGAIVIALSGTPLPYWFYAVWAIAFFAWICASPGRPSLSSNRRKIGLGIALATLTVAGIVWEGSYRFMPRFPSGRYSRLAVIGDSISAGMLGPDELTWPKQFHSVYHIDVLDLSREGATAASARKQVIKLKDGFPDDPTVLVIEIGGNDFFGSTSTAEFEKQLEALIKESERPSRQLVMIELPLPPFYNGYGRAQRDVAARYDVPMIPKRLFASVVFTEGATLDGLHLSEKGHRLMAAMIWLCVGGLLAS